MSVGAVSILFTLVVPGSSTMPLHTIYTQYLSFSQSNTFLNIFIYLTESVLSCSMQNPQCVMWDLSLWHTDSLVVGHGLQSGQTSGVVGLGLSRSVACGILVS